MADVYLAYDKVLDRHGAIKPLKARYAQDEEFVERFRREAKSAAALVNPYIVPIFDWGEAEDGTYYVVIWWGETGLCTLVVSAGARRRVLAAWHCVVPCLRERGRFGSHACMPTRRRRGKMGSRF
jgi:hypothetical protein